MSNQTSGFTPPRTFGVGIQPPGDTGVPNQSSTFGKKAGIQIVREVDGSPTITPVTILEVTDGSLTNPSPGVARVDLTVGAVTETREVILTFSETIVAGTAINIQTGVYAGAGSPAALDGDTNVTLPASGALFEGDGRIEIALNGQELNKGSGSGDDEAQWVSTTQVALSIKLKSGDELLVRAPYPTA